MRLLDNPQGVSIIAAVFIIVILAFMGVIFLTLFTTSSSTSINDLQSAQALSVAEAGIQYALKNGSFCTYNYAAVPLTASQNFTTVSQQSTATMSGAIDNVTDPVNIPLTAAPAGFVIPGGVTIESEYLFCTGIAGNSLTNCKREIAGSAIASHTGAAVTQCVVTSTGSVGSARRTARAWASRGAGGGIVVDNSSVKAERNTNLVNWPHNVGVGADRLLIVGVSFYNNPNRTVTGVTYDTVPLFPIGAVNNGNSIRVELWRLVNPNTGNNQVRVSLSGNTQAVAGAVSFTGVDQGNPIDAGPVSNTGNNAAPTVNIATLSDNAFVIDTLGIFLAALPDATANVGAGQVSQWNDRTTGGGGGTQHVRGAGSTEGPITPAGNVTMSWTLSAARSWAITAVALKPSPSGVSVISWQEVVN